MLRRLVLGLAVVTGLVAAVPRGEAADLRISFAELTRLLQVIAGGAKIYLNNVPGGLFASQSYVQITPTQSYPVDVPVKSFDILGSKYAYFIADISSTSVKVAPVPGALRLTVSFEGDGPEAIAQCLSGSCTFANVLPDIQWEGALINIDFVPIRFNGSISLEVKTVTIGGKVTAVCKQSAEFIARQACALGRPFATRTINNLRADLPNTIKAAANKQAIQQQLAEGLKRYLSLGQAGEVSISDISIDPKTMNVNFKFNQAGAAGGN